MLSKSYKAMLGLTKPQTAKKTLNTALKSRLQVQNGAIFISNNFCLLRNKFCTQTFFVSLEHFFIDL